MVVFLLLFKTYSRRLYKTCNRKRPPVDQIETQQYDIRTFSNSVLFSTVMQLNGNVRPFINVFADMG